jgi:hypothetical protein
VEYVVVALRGLVVAYSETPLYDGFFGTAVE